MARTKVIPWQLRIAAIHAVAVLSASYSSPSIAIAFPRPYQPPVAGFGASGMMFAAIAAKANLAPPDRLLHKYFFGKYARKLTFIKVSSCGTSYDSIPDKRI